MAKKKTTKKIAKDNAKRIDDLQNNMMYVAIVLGVLMILTLGYNVKTSNQLNELQGTIEGGVKAAPTGDSGNGGGGGSGSGAAQVEQIDVGVDDDPAKGDEDAPITIIEFSDFQCPFCKRFYDQTLPQVESNLVQEGKARLVYRDFPLERIHPLAKKAAEAAECADDQGKFWEYHDTIFDNQNQLSESSLKQWASDLGLNTGDFNSCLDSGKYSDEVAQDLQDGQNAGVSGTPSFIILGDADASELQQAVQGARGVTVIESGDQAGFRIVGAQPYQVFETAFKALE